MFYVCINTDTGRMYLKQCKIQTGFVRSVVEYVTAVCAARRKAGLPLVYFIGRFVFFFANSIFVVNNCYKKINIATQFVKFSPCIDFIANFCSSAIIYVLCFVTRFQVSGTSQLHIISFKPIDLTLIQRRMRRRPKHQFLLKGHCPFQGKR